MLHHAAATHYCFLWGFVVDFASHFSPRVQEMEHVRDVIWDNLVFPRWHKGDFVGLPLAYHAAVAVLTMLTDHD